MLPVSADDNIQSQILDAASDLFLHYGYDKTTIQDIADQAGISKTSLYTRWSRKDHIFRALIHREGLRYLEDWLVRVENDPDGGTFPGIYGHALESLLANPVLVAIYRQDQRVLGSLAKQIGIERLYTERQRSLLMLFQRLQEAGIVRQEVDAPTLVYLLNSLNYGLAQMPALMDPQHIPSLESVLRMVVTMIEQVVSAQPDANSERGKAVIRNYVHQIRLRMIEGD